MPICTCNSAQHQYSLRKCNFKPLWNTTPTVDVLSCSAMSDFLWPHGLQPTRLLHLWNFPDKNTGVGFHLLLQGMFLTKRSNPLLLDLLHWQADSLSLCHLGSTAKLNYVLTDFLPAEFTHFAKGILKSLITMIDSSISPCISISFYLCTLIFCY